MCVSHHWRAYSIHQLATLVFVKLLFFLLLYKIQYNKPIPHPPLTYLLSDLSNSYISGHQLHSVKSTNSEVKGTKWCRWGALHGRPCVPFPVICTPSITLTVKLSHALNWLWLHILVSSAYREKHFYDKNYRHENVQYEVGYVQYNIRL